MGNLVSSGATALIRRPSLWGVAVTQLWRMRKNGWYKSFPFLPLLNKSYFHFRIVTAYGNEDPTKYFQSDLVTYFKWCRTWTMSSK
ncbi:MAG: hypothetical protein VYA88_04670 [Actinomycetota bacterium]|nr:hypothetical protein [Actinomycetota bacterium]